MRIKTILILPQLYVLLILTLAAGFSFQNYRIGFKVKSASSTAITLIGHGSGSGLGMGQWGALGYAIEGGYSYQEILEHYYQPAFITNYTSEPPYIKVWLSSYSTGPYYFYFPFAFYLNGKYMSPQAVSVTATGSSFSVSFANSCTGTFSNATTLSSITMTENVANPYSFDSVSYICTSSGQVPYHGQFNISYNGGRPTLVNIVAFETYVADVIPAEMPANWAYLGALTSSGLNQGINALEAQAIATRSYALSRLGSYQFADICNTSICQNYPGASDELPITNQAASLTLNQVMIFSSGQVSPTYYSASTGGYSAPGVFSAVADQYDNICIAGACNPYHDWSVTLSANEIQSAFPTIGTFENIAVISRNSFGDLGGRVNEVVVAGTSGSIEITGNEFAAAFQLSSNWFGQYYGSNSELGYAVILSNGQIISFGNIYLPNSQISDPIAIVGNPAGAGGWIIGEDGQIQSFQGSEPFISSSSIFSSTQAVGAVATADGKGLWIIAQNGKVESLGDARPISFSLSPAEKILSVAPSYANNGFYALTSGGQVLTTPGIPRVPSVSGAISIVSFTDTYQVAFELSNGAILEMGNNNVSSTLVPSGFSQGPLSPANPSGFLIGNSSGQIMTIGNTNSFGSPSEIPGLSGYGIKSISVFENPNQNKSITSVSCFSREGVLLGSYTCRSQTNYENSVPPHLYLEIPGLTLVGFNKERLINTVIKEELNGN